MSTDQQYALIVVSPEALGPGSYPVDVYGPSTDRQDLEEGGHLLCDGSSGWTFVVVTWPLPEIQDTSNISVA
jgi:hypothetical protein